MDRSHKRITMVSDDAAAADLVEAHNRLKLHQTAENAQNTQNLQVRNISDRTLSGQNLSTMGQNLSSRNLSSQSFMTDDDAVYTINHGSDAEERKAQLEAMARRNQAEIENFKVVQKRDFFSYHGFSYFVIHR